MLQSPGLVPLVPIDAIPVPSKIKWDSERPGEDFWGRFRPDATVSRCSSALHQARHLLRGKSAPKGWLTMDVTT